MKPLFARTHVRCFDSCEHTALAHLYDWTAKDDLVTESECDAVFVVRGLRRCRHLFDLRRGAGKVSKPSLRTKGITVKRSKRNIIPPHAKDCLRCAVPILVRSAARSEANRERASGTHRSASPFSRCPDRLHGETFATIHRRAPYRNCMR